MACKSLKKHRLPDNLSGPIVKFAAGTGMSRKRIDIHKILLQKYTKHFDADIKSSEADGAGHLFLDKVDPAVLEDFNTWLYSGEIEKAVTKVVVKTKLNEMEAQRVENNLRKQFDGRMKTLTNLYIFAEKMAINDLMNKCIDTIQDGFLEFGTVFGPGQISKIFMMSKADSKLRELCVAANVIHLDRGCSTLREEHMMLAMTVPGYFDYVLKWIGRNFHLIGRRYEESYDNRQNPPKGFTIFNRGLLCPCHFHIHASGEAHHGHDHCAIPYMSCDH